VSVEIIAALIGAAAVIAGAWITVLPAMRRTRTAVEADGSATRDAVSELGGRLDALREGQRADASELREHVIEIRSWQAAHDAEHFLQSRPPQRGDT
jgi:hypothetical protein